MAERASTARPRTYRRNPQVQQRMDRLADHVANGGGFPAFAAAEGIDRARAYQLWQAIRTDLGTQAI